MSASCPSALTQTIDDTFLWLRIYVFLLIYYWKQSHTVDSSELGLMKWYTARCVIRKQVLWKPQHKPVDLITLIFHSMNFALYIANYKRASNVSCESLYYFNFKKCLFVYLAAPFIWLQHARYSVFIAPWNSWLQQMGSSFLSVAGTWTPCFGRMEC